MLQLQVSRTINGEFDGRNLTVGGASVEGDPRTLQKIREVLIEEQAKGPDVVYWMFRDAAKSPDTAIRYDITAMAPALLGDEPNKTYGHYHVPRLHDLPDAEIYQVMHGGAYFVLQEGEDVRSVRVLVAEAGDIVYIPPWYGHLMVNARSDEWLVTCNLVPRETKSDYHLYQKNRGGALYRLNNRFEENPGWGYHSAYEIVPVWKPRSSPLLALAEDGVLDLDLLRDPRHLPADGAAFWA